MRRPVAFLALAGLLSAAGCERLNEAMTAHTDVVARAGGSELTVDEVSGLLAKNPQVPARAEVVDAIANLWADYMVLALEARKDSTLSSLDLDEFLRPQLEQEVVLRLRDKVIKVDTAMSEEELRSRYEKEQISLQVRARHILLRFPENASAAQKDSVARLARSLRERAVKGDDFARLATQHSQDPGSGKQGGDLGFFSKGDMVGPFEEAAFKLQPGQVSDVVETPFGLHVIKVEERKLPDYESSKAQYRQYALQKAVQEQEEKYIKSLTDPLDMKVQEGAFEVVRQLAKQPNSKLGGRAANRGLIAYEGGAYTAREFQEYIRNVPGGPRAQYVQATDQQLEPELQRLARNEILVGEAQKQGLAVDKARRDSMETNIREQLRQALTETGLVGIKPQEGEKPQQAVERTVTGLLELIVTGQQQVLPVGPIAATLRDEYDAEVFERAYPTVVARLEATRPQPTAPAEGTQPAPGEAPPASPPAPADTPAGGTR